MQILHRLVLLGLQVSSMVHQWILAADMRVMRAYGLIAITGMSLQSDSIPYLFPFVL